MAVFVFQGPFNNDDHFEVVKYVYDYGAIPVTGMLRQSDHPPLYYILASLLVPGGAKAVQGFSLLLSIGTLFVIYRLISKMDSIKPLRVKVLCLSLACTLPQFVMFGSYVSNDSLAFFIGSLIFFQMYSYINKPGMLNQSILAALLGLGMLAKGTFASFLPALMFLVLLANLRGRNGFKKTAFSLIIFLTIALSIGAYKYAHNTLYLGRPLILVIDMRPDLITGQQPTYIGLYSVFDMNLLKLVMHPIFSEHTRYSYPLLLYGTLWYQYIPESNFSGNMTELGRIGSLIYVLALLPTLLFLIGSIRISSLVKHVWAFVHSKRPAHNAAIYELACLALLASNLILVVYMGVKYDIWTWFQSRYLFTSFFSFVLLLNSGLGYIGERKKAVQILVTYGLCILFLLFIAYFMAEISGQLCRGHEWLRIMADSQCRMLTTRVYL